MGAKLFRYLFENTPDAIIMAGCMWDKSVQEQIRFVYSCEVIRNNQKQDGRKDRHIFCSQSELNLFAMGAFLADDIERLIYIVRHGKIDTVVLPYVPPIQRMMIMQSLKAGKTECREMAEFLKKPYEYLKKTAVKRIYFVYGNGRALEKTDEKMYPGYYFELQEKEILDIIEELEGWRVPVVKAGYIIDNGMLFYFGYFGTNLRQVRHFMHHYMKNDPQKKFYDRKMQRMLLAYRKEFGDPGMDALTMFCSPIEIMTSQTDCVLHAIVADKKNFCHTNIAEDEGRCSLKCLLYNDYDVCRCHRTDEVLRMGVLFLGNIKLNRHLFELNERYKSISSQVRVVTFPGGWFDDDWDHEPKDLNFGKNVIFWMCPLQSQILDQVLWKIKCKNARYRMVGLDEEYGCCVNGFLTEKNIQ